MRSIACLITGIFLLCCSVEDIRTRTVSAWLLLCGTVLVFGWRFFVIYSINSTAAVVCFMIQDVFMFVLLKFFSMVLKEKMGTADFDVLFVIFLDIGISGMIISLFTACIFVLISSLPHILRRDTKIKECSVPFIPYLFAGYIATLLVRGMIFI